MTERMIKVEVVYADETSQVIRRVELHHGSTVAQGIQSSAIAQTLLRDTVIEDVGIFGRKVALDHMLLDGDRIEIYRPLILDPMEARRRRVR